MNEHELRDLVSFADAESVLTDRQKEIVLNVIYQFKQANSTAYMEE